MFVKAVVMLTVALSASGVDAAPVSPKVAPSSAAKPVGPVPRQATVLQTRTELLVELARARRLPKGLTGAERKSVRRIVSRLRRGRNDEAMELWESFVAARAKKNARADSVRPSGANKARQNTAPKTKPVPIEPIRDHIVYQALLAPDKKLAAKADRLRFLIDGESALAGKRTYLKQKLDDARGTRAVQVELPELKLRYSPGGAVSEGTSSAEMDAATLQAEIEKVEAQQETVRNERQMMSTQFNNVGQKTSQFINMLSSILKTMHETSQATIRNLR